MGTEIEPVFNVAEYTWWYGDCLDVRQFSMKDLNVYEETFCDGSKGKK